MTVLATSSVMMSVLKPVHVECSLSLVHVNQVSIHNYDCIAALSIKSAVHKNRKEIVLSMASGMQARSRVGIFLQYHRIRYCISLCRAPRISRVDWS